MKWAALVTALSNLFLKIAEIIGRQEAERKRDEFEQEVQEIRDDPADYFNRTYPRVRPDNGDPETLSRDYEAD